MSEVAILSNQDIGSCLGMAEAISEVEHCFKVDAENGAVCPPKLYLDLPQYHGDFRAMPSFINGSVGIKWVAVYPDNWKRGLPTVTATIVLSDPATGCPLAILDGTYITNIRTGAAGGVAAKYLARKDASVVGMIGAGTQARTQLLALREVMRDIKEVKVFDQKSEASSEYSTKMSIQTGLSVRPVQTIKEAVDADIVVTTTPSTVPVVPREAIKPGTHINAIGADAKGKQELAPEILKVAKIVVDSIEQASHSGEINMPISTGLITSDDIYASLGEIVAGIKKGRESDEEITVFDSTGIAIQDIACAGAVYKKLSHKQINRVKFC